jgi:hypothetical protein
MPIRCGDEEGDGELVPVRVTRYCLAFGSFAVPYCRVACVPKVVAPLVSLSGVVVVSAYNNCYLLPPDG